MSVEAPITLSGEDAAHRSDFAAAAAAWITRRLQRGAGESDSRSSSRLKPLTATWQTAPSRVSRCNSCGCLSIFRFDLVPDLSSQVPWHRRSQPSSGSETRSSSEVGLWKMTTTHLNFCLSRCSPFPLMASSSTPSRSHRADRVWKW